VVLDPLERLREVAASTEADRMATAGYWFRQAPTLYKGLLEARPIDERPAPA
jgi:hypothetical protein